MEELMQRARSRDTFGVSDVIYDMIAAGLTPGPRSFHGLVVAHVLNVDVEEELVRGRYLEDANAVFLKGAKGGLRATNELYDLMIEEDCKAGDHSNALEIAYEMEAAGRMATTFIQLSP
ncbi:Gibberellin-regulated protein [Hibiscus syriacus]|uniref:Gibberellin-regulated protein n=1 Tax=Hibiscus syriacus TaxID=106335 RepID=A0A6A3AGU2_HIBSY|nr:Gibberellin-regulated protein [Hibiscus syriacus]